METEGRIEGRIGGVEENHSRGERLVRVKAMEIGRNQKLQTHLGFFPFIRSQPLAQFTTPGPLSPTELVA